MAGYGYTGVIRRYSITAAALGGYAIGTIRISDPAEAAYRRTLGVPSAEANATNTFVFKPEVGVWYDLTKKVYLNVNAGYTVKAITRTETSITDVRERVRRPQP